MGKVFLIFYITCACYTANAFSKRKYVTWTHRKYIYNIHNYSFQEMFFDLASVTNVTWGFSVFYFRLFKDRSFNNWLNWLFGRKSLEYLANVKKKKKKVKSYRYNNHINISYIHHWCLYISRIRIIGFKSLATSPESLQTA